MDYSTPRLFACGVLKIFYSCGSITTRIMGLVFHLIVVASLLGLVAGNTCAISDSEKKDCGYAGIDESSCLAKGCCWTPSGWNSQTPWCYYQGSSSSGYKVVSMTETSYGLSGTLKLAGESTSAYGPELSDLKVFVYYETSDILRIKITDASESRWEVPNSVIKRTTVAKAPSSLNYEFRYSESPFLFEVVRKSDGVSVFKTDKTFVYKDQYLELSTSFAAGTKTYGIGESARLEQALQSGHTYTLWAADIPSISMYQNLYSSFPFYVQLSNGVASGALLLNSNGMDVTLESTSLTFKAVGGIMDLYVFVGSTPNDVVSQYTSIVGRPTMMPYWSLGFHNCKYGYKSVYEVEDIVKKYANANIPLDTQWMDIDYMQNYRDFTFDSSNFPTSEVNSFVSSLHTNGQHFVPIIDPGIMVYSGYDAYEQGMKDGIFIKDISGSPYLGQVWPGPTYFPDFLHPSAQSYWTGQIQSFYNMVPIDGIWIDMNEVSNFCNSDGNGQVCSNTASNGCPAPGASQTDCCLVCKQVDSSNKYDYPPYSINNAYGKLSTKTIAVSATQYGNVSVYNSHNLYGLTEQIATNVALSDVRGKRPFLLSRSSFPSTGAHSAKWTGDNGATWNDLKSSIISVVDFNIFGVPMIGADICGFIMDTTEELCARWIEVGAFYPFSRDHNTLGAAPQELYLWNTVAEAARNALGIRYQVLPFMYTLFYHAHVEGSTVARSLWMNFPEDSNTIGKDGQFMLGNGLLISPVLDQGSTNVNAYFPTGLWYKFSDRRLDVDASAGSVYRSIYTPLTSVNVHIRGGSVLPLQNAALTTTAGRQTPFTLLAALCPGGKAFGDLFWDDGEQINIENYLTVSYEVNTSATEGSFTAVIGSNTYSSASSFKVGTIVVMGTNSFIHSVKTATLNGVAVDSSSIAYDAADNRITFTVSVPLNSNINLEWTY